MKQFDKKGEDSLSDSKEKARKSKERKKQGNALK